MMCIEIFKWCVTIFETGKSENSLLQKSKLQTGNPFTVKFLWNNTGVIIKLPGALFKHTACGENGIHLLMTQTELMSNLKYTH